MPSLSFQRSELALIVTFHACTLADDRERHERFEQQVSDLQVNELTLHPAGGHLGFGQSGCDKASSCAIGCVAMLGKGWQSVWKAATRPLR